ncbi:hypothetical protein HWV62_44319 [Athelia sp. TMB]|nr:hypothetical protein HWV62_44319 [Athelia sp. TMB]
MTLVSLVPAHCIVLLEDLDAAFTRGVTRDSDSTGTPGGDKNKDQADEAMGPMAPPSSSRSRRNREARATPTGSHFQAYFLATTNHLECLDLALSRQGRMNASKWQAEAHFRNFFPSTDEKIKDEREMEKELAAIDLPTTPAPQSPTTSTLWSMSPSPFASSVDPSVSPASAAAAATTSGPFESRRYQ